MRGPQDSHAARPKYSCKQGLFTFRSSKSTFAKESQNSFIAHTLVSHSDSLQRTLLSPTPSPRFSMMMVAQRDRTHSVSSSECCELKQPPIVPLLALQTIWREVLPTLSTMGRSAQLLRARCCMILQRRPNLTWFVKWVSSRSFKTDDGSTCGCSQYLYWYQSPQLWVRSGRQDISVRAVTNPADAGTRTVPKDTCTTGVTTGTLNCHPVRTINRIQDTWIDVSW